MKINITEKFINKKYVKNLNIKHPNSNVYKTTSIKLKKENKSKI